MRVVVTGEGIISAIGRNKAETLQSLLEKRSGVGQVRHLPTQHKELPVGEVAMSDDELKAALDIDPGREVSRTALMAIHAIVEALDDAGLDADYLRGKRVALVSGTTVAGMDVTERHFIADDKSDDMSFMMWHDCGSNTHLIAAHFGFIDKRETISTACSSAANAIIVGSEMLRADEADIVIAGGTEALSLFHLNGFNSLMILDHEPCRPFDATRAGLNLGEGAAYVILEREGVRDHQPHAYLAGYGNACDAFHQTASSPNGEGAYLAMSQALDMAAIKPGDINYVNAHGTGTPNNDETELAALRRVFGDKMPPVSSTKAFTGHTTSASGSIETVICLLAMKHGFVPANLNWQHAMEGFTPSLGESGVALYTVLCNSFGFGGNDSALVLSLKPGREFATITSDIELEFLGDSKIESEEDLGAIRDYVSPMEARRMGKLMKASLITSHRALAEAGIECPDAIITGTAHGCVVNSEQILCGLRDDGENTVKPTLFMQSTHNTLSSNIAMHLKCHGYNITYSHGNASMELALRDAKRLIWSGRARNVLVGWHDECTPMLREMLVAAHMPTHLPIFSYSMIVRCRE